MVMLTPAEALGLSGYHVDSRLRKAVLKLPPSLLRALGERVERGALERHLIYLREGRIEPVRLLLCPLAILPEQESYLNRVSLTIVSALKRLPDLYLRDEQVRATLPLCSAEEEWLRQSWSERHSENNPIFGRLDAVVQFTTPHWKESLRFLEPNLCSVGGVHYTPAANEIISQVVVPELRNIDPWLELSPGVDERELFIQAVNDHLRCLSRPGRRLCLIEPTDARSGPDEQVAIIEYFRRAHGLLVQHADPRELRLVGDEVYCGDTPIDLAYRDYELRELLELEQKSGQELSAMRALFRQNRVLSSIAGDLDHKSCWELLTEPELAQRHFGPEERRLFARHVLWTRLVYDRRTTLPDSGEGDLVDYIRRERECLVLKPNRDYGGHGVTIGPLCTQAEWEAALHGAMSAPRDWVVQQLTNLPVHEFPVVADDGAVHMEPFYVVMGLSPSEDGLGVLCRASQKQVVNIAQRGGMVSVLLSGASPQLEGPRAPAPPPLDCAENDQELSIPRLQPARPIEPLWEELRRRMSELCDLDAALGLLGWDEETYCPEEARTTRGRQSGTLEALRQRLLCDPMFGELLCMLSEVTTKDSEAGRVLFLLRRRRQQALCVPEKLLRELSLARSRAAAAWEEARLHGDFAPFAPELAAVVSLCRERATALCGELLPYDALLDEHEPGLRAQEVFAAMAALAVELRNLLRAIGEKPPQSDAILRTKRFDSEAQWKLFSELTADLGFDFRRGRLERSSHPFTLQCSEHDVRMTTRILGQDLLSGLLATMHELGHGLYDQGFPSALHGTVLAEAPGMGMHEAQARLWENHVGRSRAFFRRYQPRLAQRFASQLSGISAEELYRAANVVSPGLTRMDADELTYDLHIIMRCELEMALLSGDLKSVDLPYAWAERMDRYLGLRVADHRTGCLQDIHWAQGLFGFFPMYTLGNLYAAQLMDAFSRSEPAGYKTMQTGDFRPLLGWLRAHIHQHGNRLSTSELLVAATGQGLSAAPHLRYLRCKYGELYGL